MVRSITGFAFDAVGTGSSRPIAVARVIVTGKTTTTKTKTVG